MNAQGRRGWLLLTGAYQTGADPESQGVNVGSGRLWRRTLDVVIGRRGYTRASKLWGTKGRKIM